MDNENKTGVDYDLLKQVVRLAAIGLVVGMLGTFGLIQMGIPLPVATAMLFIGWCAYAYMDTKADQKKQAEANDAIWLQAFQAGMEAEKRVEDAKEKIAN